MKTFLIAFLVVLSNLTNDLFAQELIKKLQGSWKAETNIEGKPATQLLMVSGNYFSLTEYVTADGDFLSTKGGKFTMLDNENAEILLEFNTLDSTLIMKSEEFKVKLTKKGLQIKSDFLKKNTFKQVESETASPLQNPWLFSGRKRNGEMSRRSGDRPRKTMKILTDTHFQWIAYNTETGKFFGTGGGTYSAKDGVYTENIEFFSRDKNRVGAALKFNFEVKGEDWHHTGKSSKGDPMYEIWSTRK